MTQHMIKILRNLYHRDKDRFRIPRSVQQTIPIRRLWKDGVFEVTKGVYSKGVYSKTYRFTDINYADASPEDKATLRKHVSFSVV